MNQTMNHKSHPWLVLFDIDGTLLKSDKAGVHAMAKVCRQMFGPAFHFDVDTSGMLDPVIFAMAAQANGIEDHAQHHDTFAEAYLAELARELKARADKVRSLPGMAEAVDSLVERSASRGDVIVGLLTGNYAAAAPLKLKAAGYDPDVFTLGAFADDGPTRPDLAAAALTKLERTIEQQPDPTRVIVIGDTPHDVNCAKVHGCIALGVGTGSYSADALRDAGADIAVDDLSDPVRLYDLLD